MGTEIVVEREETVLYLAGAGPRLISWFIDNLVAAFIVIVFMYVSENVGGTVGTILVFLAIFAIVIYYTYFFGNGQTPGMMVMKIKLIGTDGTNMLNNVL